MKRIYSIAVICLLSGCSTFMSGGKQTVTVVTPDIDGASCSLSDSKGRVWYIEETPGTALVKKGDGPISVICEKDGFQKGTAMLKEVISASNYGNLALGPAAPIGYFVDGMSGSGQRYENSVEVYLDPIDAPKPWDAEYDYDED